MNNTISPRLVLGKGLLPHQIPRQRFFLEESLPENSFNVQLVYGPVEKRQVNFEGNLPGQVSTFASTLLSLSNGRYRLYATTREFGEISMGISVWESDDGLTWEPSLLGQREVTHQPSNLIFFEGLAGNQLAVGQPQIVPLRDGRWRMYFWKHGDSQVRYLTAESEDGLHWRVTGEPVLYHPGDKETREIMRAGEETEFSEEYLVRKRLLTNDATHVYYNSVLDRYECYSVWLHPAIPDRRVETDNCPGMHRLIHRRLSQDGLAWSEPELLLIPDSNDPWDLQFYFLAVQSYQDFLVGSLGYYRVEEGQQSMDTELGFSFDGGRKWHRPVRGGFIPRSHPESKLLDTVGIYASNTWIDTGEDWLCLYTDTAFPHNAKKCLTKPAAATFKKGRMVGVAAGVNPGGFLTPPFFPTTSELRLDANIKGWLRAELCDGFGRKLPGFHLMDSLIIRGDNQNHILRWKTGLPTRYLYQCVRIRFELADGVIYSFSW
ncbi:MAG: hypothetical protein NC911_05865 [Candidatus Omnitrophica bacterium]|nr:hypothetical protein [Candidatus Omnitrophota bacterium]